MPRKKPSAKAAPPRFDASGFSSIVLDGPLFDRHLLPTTPPPRPADSLAALAALRTHNASTRAQTGGPDPVPPMKDAPSSPGGGLETLVHESRLGELALFLLDALGGALTLLPHDRPWDTRRCLQLLCRLATRGDNPAAGWHAVLGLPARQLTDVVERARTAQALLGDDARPPAADIGLWGP